MTGMSSGQDVLRIAEVDERGQYAFAVDFGQAPVIVIEHLDHSLDLGQALCDEVRQRLALADILDDDTDRVDNIAFLGVANDVA